MPGKEQWKPKLERDPKKSRQDAHSSESAQTNKKCKKRKQKTVGNTKAGKDKRAGSKVVPAKNANRIIEPVKPHEMCHDPGHPTAKEASRQTCLAENPQKRDQPDPGHGEKSRSEERSRYHQTQIGRASCRER